MLPSELNLWFLDDGTLSDEPERVLNDFKILIEEAKKIGLEINPTICELYFCSDKDDEILSEFNQICPGISVVNDESLNLLGAPIFDESFKSVSEKLLRKLKIMFGRMKNLNSHTAYCLLKFCFGMPKLTFT